MITLPRLWPRKRSLTQISSSSGQQRRAAKTKEVDGSESPSTSERKPIEINTRHRIRSLAFLADGDHVIGGGEETKIRCWGVKDGKETRAPMDVGDAVCNIAVSQDGKWIVSGMECGEVAVWDVESCTKVNGFRAHDKSLAALDVSPDTKKIAGGSDTGAYVWSLAGQRLLNLSHDEPVCMVKFSPDSRLLVTGSSSIRVYNCENGHLLVDISRIPVTSIAWSSDSKQLFALSCDGNIHCLDVFSGMTHSQWPIHSNIEPRCISIADNGTFIATSAGSSVSLWDTSTHQQICPVIHHSAHVDLMAISANYALLMSGDSKIASWDLLHTLPSPYIDNHKRAEAHLRETIHSLRTQNGHPTHEKFVNLENAFQMLQDATKQKIDKLNETIESLRADLRAKGITSSGLENTVQQLRVQLADSRGMAKQKEDSLDKTIKSLNVELATQNTKSDERITDLKELIQGLRFDLTETQQITSNTLEKLSVELFNSHQTIDTLAKVLRVHQWKHRCEALYADSRVIDAADLLKTMKSAGEDVKVDAIITDWLSGFTDKCIIALEGIGDELLGIKRLDEALAAYASALNLGPSSWNNLLNKWVGALLLHGSIPEALECANEFKLPRFAVYQVICDVLEGDSRVREALECFQQMQSELTSDKNIDNERTQWERRFPQRCAEKLENLADSAVYSQRYNEAENHFSTILSLDPPNRVNILIKRSKVRIVMESLEDALSDANEAIKLDPSTHLGHEQRYRALHKAGRYAEAVEAFEMMLSKLDEFADERVHRPLLRYTDPRPQIRHIINTALSHMPQVLIDTTTGQLLDRAEQAEAFEADPIFDELVSSMTTGVDDERIRIEVKRFYRYVMLSHRWQRNEPRFGHVKDTTVYKLKVTPGNLKLQTFCSIVFSLGFRWAWSDTCCINQENNVVLQESLVAMFTWYRGSSLTIVYLLGVLSQLEVPGSLQNSIWNTRAWTYPEYVAADVIQFYTEDWKPYLGLTLSNHKKSHIVISEMEQVSRVSAERLTTIQPGLERIREKLYMASMRQTTRVEDIAYSLLGVFDVSIPVIYGEGTRAVGRFLEHILARSRDITILAWTGPANGYNSCLPLNLTAYDPLEPPHIPRMETVELKHAMELQSSIRDLSLVTKLYNLLHGLKLGVTPGSGRLQLPCICFPTAELVHLPPDSNTTSYVYRATTGAFDDIIIKTTRNLNLKNEHFLVHPWILPLLDQEHSCGAAELGETMRGPRLVARLRQQFGALLLEKVSRTEYKRVAADSLIIIQIRGEVSLTELMDSIKTIDVL